MSADVTMEILTHCRTLPGPCECPGLPRCPKCGYTAHDAAFWNDHKKCGGTIPLAVDDDGREQDERQAIIESRFDAENRADRATAQCELLKEALIAAIEWVDIQTGNCRASADAYFANKARLAIKGRRT